MALNSCFPQTNIPDPVTCNSICELGPPDNCTEDYIEDAVAYGSDPPLLNVLFIGAVSGNITNGLSYTVDGSNYSFSTSSIPSANVASYNTNYIPSGSVVYYVYDGSGDLAVDGSLLSSFTYLVEVLN